MSLLLHSAGLLDGIDTDSSTDEKQTAIHDHLVNEADGYHVGGGGCTLQEWAALSPTEKGAMIAAGERKQLEFVVALARAMHSPAALAVMAEQVDGGLLKAVNATDQMEQALLAKQQEGVIG